MSTEGLGLGLGDLAHCFSFGPGCGQQAPSGLASAREGPLGPGLPGSRRGCLTCSFDVCGQVSDPCLIKTHVLCLFTAGSRVQAWLQALGSCL